MPNQRIQYEALECCVQFPDLRVSSCSYLPIKYCTSVHLKKRFMSRFRMQINKAGERRKQQETKDNDEHTPAIKSSHPSPQAPAQRAQVARSRPPASALARPCHTACKALRITTVNHTDVLVDGQIVQRTHPRTVPRPTVRAGRSQPRPSRHPEPEHSKPQQA